MCDFKVGDEVVCIDDSPRDENQYKAAMLSIINEGSAYTVSSIKSCDRGSVVILVSGMKPGFDPDTNKSLWFSASRFRRIQRRDLAAWLNQSVGNTDKLDTKKVRVK